MVDRTVGGTLRPELEAALASCFDAVIAQDSWPRATEALAAAMGALGSCFHMFGAGERRLEAPMSIRYREMLAEFLAGGWGDHDVRGQRGWPLARKGPRVILENDISTPEERARLPIYNELFRRHDLETFAGLTFRANGRLWAFNIVRSQAMGDYGFDTAQQLSWLAPQVSRLICFGEVMSQAAAQGAMATLERSATGAILLDWNGRVLEMNEAARHMMGSGLTVRAGRVCADWPGAQPALEALVASAVHDDTGHLRSGLGPIAAPKPSGGMLLVDAVTTGSRMGGAFGRYGALLMVTDPGRRHSVSRTLLRRLYGLTNREAEVAERIGAGEGAGDIAERLELKTSSVRQLIKAVLEKTGTARQSELAALVSRLPASPRDGRG